jgi:phage shock protein B
MSDNLTAIIICVVCTLGPVWITFNFLARSRAARTLNVADAAALEQMQQSMQMFEQRIAVLERILDAEVPDWRRTSAQGVRNHAAI